VAAVPFLWQENRAFCCELEKRNSRRSSRDTSIAFQRVSRVFAVVTVALKQGRWLCDSEAQPGFGAAKTLGRSRKLPDYDTKHRGMLFIYSERPL